MIEIKKLSKKYNNNTELTINSLSIKIADGEICALLGRNGAGKTTILKCAAGILDFKEGDILIDKLSLLKNPIEYKRRIAYLPDSPDIYDFLKGIDYLNFICDVYKVVDKEAKIKKYSDIFELTGFLGNTISTYSYGMKQKLLIIASLVHEPKYLFLDEPFNYLDSFGISTLKKVLKELSEEKKTIIYSTNKLEEAKAFKDKVAIIEKGKLVAYDKIEDISKEVIKNVVKNDE